MLHSMRKRMRAMAEAEAGGTSFWDDRFSDRVRTRVSHALARIAERGQFETYRIFVDARQRILEQEGGTSVFGEGLNAHADFEVLLKSGQDDSYPSAIEALILAMFGHGEPVSALQFRDAVNEVFSQERVAWKLVEIQMVEMKSEELHDALVEPALRLLHDARFAAVDTTYRKALDEPVEGRWRGRCDRRRDGAPGVADLARLRR